MGQDDVLGNRQPQPRTARPAPPGLVEPLKDPGQLLRSDPDPVSWTEMMTSSPTRSARTVTSPEGVN